MDKQQIIDEIMTRVIKKIDDIERSEAQNVAEVKKDEVKPVEVNKQEVKSATACSSCSSSPNVFLYEKKLLSEKCFMELKEKGVTKIQYKKGTIVTEAAKEMAQKHKIEIELI